MAREKKKKKEKVENGLKKKTWGPVQTSLSVVGGIAGVVGATVLGVYFAGGFKERVVNPEAISFVYEANLFNADYNQIETCDDFTLTIVAPNQGVTKDKVTLSFNGTNPTIKNDGYISNTIISVPEVVKIGQSFTVSLATEYLKNDEGEYILDNNSRINWIKGGLSSLVASSEYDQLSTTSIQIAVDVPVYRTETIVVNSTGTETNQIVTGESFTLKTKFIPSKSQYMFSDYYEDRNSVLVKNDSIGNNAARKKLSYFEAKNNSGVTPVYEDRYNMHFMAGSNAVDSITVTGYTYNTAKAQLDFQTTIVDLSDAEYYNSNIVNLASTEDGVNSVAQVSISEASISTFVVSQNSISAEVNRPFRMYVQENRYEQASKYLGARVVSTSGAILDSMSTKLALAFVYNSQDAVGNVLEVSAIDSGLSVSFGGNEVKLYQPNSNVSDLRYVYWTLTATEKREINVYAYLIVNGEHGDALFRDNNNDVVRYDLTLNVEEHAEGDLIWLDNTKYSVTLSFDETGLNPQTVDLGQFVSVPADNIYKDVVFFAYFGDRTEENAATIDEKAQTVLGVNGYNSTRSGYYSTRGGDIYLYAINGDHATLSGTGEFKLYFATVTGEFYADNTYKIAVMGEGYKEIDCRKALSENSIQGDESDFSEFGTDENIYLDAGNDASFIVSFKVNGESISVFKEEFELQKIQFAAKGSVNSEEIDITQNFKIEDVTFNATTGELSYYLTIDKDKDIQNNLDGGVKITKFVLMQQDSSLVWENEVSSDQSIILYKPVTQTIVVENEDLAGYLNGTSKVSVNQTLTTSGTFSVNIQAGSDFETIGSFLDSCFKNKVTITDQLGQTDTLKNKWHFVVSDDDYSIVNLSDNGKNFTFRNGTDDSIKISIKSNDNDTVGKVGNNDVQLILDVTSVGIQKIKQAADNRKFDFTGDMVDATQSTVTVERYGNQTTGEKIAITNFVKFYLDNDANSEFENIEFTLSSTYISTLYSNGTLQELFGEGGMITLYSGNNAIGGADAESLKTNLTGTNITAIKINKDFAAEHKIEFLISDNGNVGAVNTVFNLKINPNITITSVDYSDLYAEAAFTFTNDVTYQYGTGGSSQTRKLGSLYTAGTTYYIVPKEGSEPLYYYLSTDSANAVGEFKYANAETKIKFYDFWDENSKIYWVRFQPLGENSYLIDQRISFNINRNIIVGAGIKDTYEILESAPNITDFVSIQRSSGSASIPTLTYEFVNDGNNSDYLTIVDGKIAITGKILAFGYNEQELTRTLAVKCGDDEIGRITIKIKPLNNFYTYIAEKFKYSNDDSVVAKIKNVGDVQYLMVDISDNKIQWYFGDSNISARKLAQNSFYNVLSLEYVNLAFVAQNALLYGLNNESAYLGLQFDLGDNKGFSAKVPVIVSQIGFDQVVYDGENETSSLEHALTRPEDLIKQGIYNEINAGTVTQILNSSSGAGLYTINGNVNSLMFYSFEEINYDNGNEIITARTAQDLIKSIQIDNNNNQQKIMLSLNHLSDSINDMYLAFEYTVINGTLTQTFYYVLKVIPDVTVEEVVYPYDSNEAHTTEEHMCTPINTEGQINLESKFDNTTLHKGEKRFNLSKKSGTLEDVAFTNEIYSVTVDDYATYYVKETSGDTLGWSGYIDLNFSDDHSILYFTPKTGNKFAVVVKHTYPGSVDGLSVVGGEQYYTLVINENTVHYSLRYMASDNFDNDYESILPDNNNCTWNMTNYVRGTGTYYQEVKADVVNGDNYSEYYIKKYQQAESYDSNTKYYNFIDEEYVEVNASDVNDDNYSEYYVMSYAHAASYDGNVTYFTVVKTKTITINLIENAQAGQSQSGTIVYNELNIHLLSGAVPYYSYNAATGEFVLGLDDYLDKDKTLTFAVYTKYGYLGTLTVNIGANAEFEFETDVSTNLQGGTTSTFAGIFNIKRDADGVTNYTVTAEITGEGSDFVTFNNGFTVADLLTDKSISVTFTVTFNDDKQFIFTQGFTLKQNITPKSSYTPDNYNVISGDEYGLDDVSNFYTDTLGTSNAKIKSVSSTNAAFVSFDDSTGKITTNYVSEPTNLDLTVTVTLTFNNHTQEFQLTYSIVLYPSVELSTTYPNPTEIAEIDAEYIENGSTFEDVCSNFINQSPMFASSYRIISKGGNVSGNNVAYGTSSDIDDSNLEVKITTLQNASVMSGYEKATSYSPTQTYYSYDSDTQTYSEATGVTADDFSNYYAASSIKSGKNVPTSGSITFKRGTYNSVTGLYPDDGTESIVTFTITYRSVVTTYTVKIRDNVISAVTNMASNNVKNSGLSDYEAIYVDQTSTSDMFAKGRMAKVKVASNLTGYKNTYYLVFTQYNKANISQFSNGVTYYILSNGRYVQVEDDAEFENNVTYYTCTNQYYASYPIYFGENDQGKTLTIDLGRSFAGKTFVGAYLASTFDTYITINNSSYGQINYGNGGSVTASGKIYVLVDPEKVAFNPLTTYYTKSGGEYIRAQGITSFDPDKTYYTAIDNLESHLFTSNLTLTNRIQLRYADAYDVDYSYFGSILPQFNIPSNNDIDTLYSTTPFSSDFRANNGSGKAWSLGLTYYYMPKIDIEVEEQIKMDASYQEVTVNIEHQSVVDLFGIKHATTGQNLDKSDFASSGATMTMSLVSAVANADENIVIDTQNNKTLDDAQAKYISEYGPFASGKQYLAFTALLTNNTQAYDYNLLPLGAKNAGDYQLIKITYTISGFTKVFYTVVRILPDYTLSFGGSEGNIQDEGDYTSNVNAYVLTVPASEEYYGDSITHTFTLTSSASASGYLSVKHSNGNDTTSELASTFTITLTTGQNLNGKYYNNATNVANKLMTSNAGNWISSTGKYTYKTSGTAVSFKNAPQVIFGNQDYVIEGEDYYGYKYRVYFTLQSKYSIPEATQSTYELTENEYFDIGTEFKLLSIEKESSNNNLYITSETTQPVNENNAKLITLTGINAWLFDKDYVLSDTTYQYLTKNTSDGGYGLKTDPAYSMSTSDKEYLNINNLILNKVTIEGISFSDANGNPLNESITVTGRDLATAKKVDTTNKYTYNGFSGRDAGGGEVDSLVSGVQFYTNEKAQPSGYNGSTKYYYQNGSVFSIFAVTNADYLRDYFTFRQASSYDSNTKYFSYDSTNDKYTLVTSGVDLENFASYFTKEKATVYVNNGNYYYEGSTSDTFEKSNIINSSDYFKDYYTFSEANSYSAGVTYYVYNQVGDSYSKAMNYGDMLQMPRITNTDIFGSSNITNITMNISLKYDGGGTNEEYYTCPVTISLQRGLQIIEHAVLAHDAEPITVSSNYTVQTTNTYSYINDTLEVVIPTNDSITFDMVLKRENNEIAQAKNVSLSNSGNSFTMTYYMSLSSKFNMNVKVGDTVQISNVRGGCVAMYYITDAKADAATTALTFTGGTAEITIGIITQDKIFVDNALMLQANGYYTTTKYYILKYTEGVKDYYYRLSKMYYVTGKYYKMATQTSQIERVLTYNPTPFATWSNSINLYSGLVSTTGISNGTAGQTPDLNNLKIEIDSSSGGSGNAEYIDKTGAIKLLSGWSTEQYIRVVVKMRVSGYDRYISGKNDTDNPGYVTLGTLILGSGQYSITYKDQGNVAFSGEYIGLPQYAISGSTVVLPTPLKEYYTFLGWYSDSGCTNQITQLENVTSNQTVYAKWKANVLTINYHLNGGGATETNHFSNADPARVDNWAYGVEWPYGLTNPSNDRVTRNGYTASQVYYNTLADGSGYNVRMDSLSYAHQVAEDAGVLNDFKAGDTTIDLYIIWTANS